MALKQWNIRNASKAFSQSWFGFQLLHQPSVEISDVEMRFDIMLIIMKINEQQETRQELRFIESVVRTWLFESGFSVEEGMKEKEIIKNIDTDNIVLTMNVSLNYFLLRFMVWWKLLCAKNNTLTCKYLFQSGEVSLHKYIEILISAVQADAPSKIKFWQYL